MYRNQDLLLSSRNGSVLGAEFVIECSLEVVSFAGQGRRVAYLRVNVRLSLKD
jgi:hypothetical protein